MSSDTDQSSRSSHLQITPSGKIINNHDGLMGLRHPLKKRTVNHAPQPKITAAESVKSSDLSDQDGKVPSRKSSRSRKSLVKKRSKPSNSKLITDAPKTHVKTASRSQSRTSHSPKKQTPDQNSNKPQATPRIRKASSLTKPVDGQTDDLRRSESQSRNRNPGHRSPKVSVINRISARSLRNNRRSKSRVRQTVKVDEEFKPEPAFFQKVTPDFYARLRQVASETPANILSSLKQARKNQLAKLETLTSIHAKEKKPNRSTNSQISYAEAREALSMSKPGPLPDPTKRPDDDIKISSEPENVAKPINRITGKGSNVSNGQGILCHGFSCGAKKTLRFAESTKELHPESSPSNSNNTRRLSCNVLGGCVK